MQKYEWKVKHKEVEDIFGQLLIDRGLHDPKDVAAFLEPDWDAHTHDPYLFTHMDAAVKAVFNALANGERITIHGDYDADGVSGSSLLYSAIQEIAVKLNLEATLNVFLPDREKDGYGVAMHTIERLAAEGTKLLITVDCGISNLNELQKAHELGMQVIICDHHQLAESGKVPEHAMIIHPLAPGETYPNKHLCGTGVAFKLASCLFDEARKRGADFPVGHEKWYLDLVAIATVTDVMPLLGENRVLEKYGLMVLKKTRRPGIQKILQISKTKPDAIDTTAIGFRIGPRLNAAGRISSAEKAFKALVASFDDAEEHVAELEQLNRDRQKISRGAYKEAKVMVQEIEDDVAAHVLWQDYWNPGIVGLIAGRTVTEFGVPAFALTKVNDHYVGSGRSIGGMHLVEAMRSCGDIFIKAGGHPQACGLSIEEKHLPAFKEGIQAFARDFFGEETPRPQLQIDAEIPLQSINWDLVHSLDKLQPFGQKNPQPIFIARGAQVVSAEAIGKTGSHLRLTVNPPSGDVIQCIGFGFGKRADLLGMGSLVDIVFEIGINEWNGRRDIQLSIKDLHFNH